MGEQQTAFHQNAVPSSVLPIAYCLLLTAHSTQPTAKRRGTSGRWDDIVLLMQTRYLIIASLITAMVILIAGAWWFYARAV